MQRQHLDMLRHPWMRNAFPMYMCMFNCLSHCIGGQVVFWLWFCKHSSFASCKTSKAVGGIWKPSLPSLRSQVVEGEDWVPEIVIWLPYVCHDVHTETHRQTHRQTHTYTDTHTRHTHTDSHIKCNLKLFKPEKQEPMDTLLQASWLRHLLLCAY